eukprot:5319121-Amphidinium_carterae.2
MAWRADARMAEDALRVVFKRPGPAVVHPEAAAGGVEHGPRRVVTLSGQGPHGYKRRAIQATLNALEVGPTGND